jgi:hypothetical protein
MEGRSLLLLAIALPALVVAAGYGILRYLTSVPGVSHEGALPPLTEEEMALAKTLKRHIETIAAHEHNVAHHEELEKVARAIEATLAAYGYSVGRQEFTANGKAVRNIDVIIEPRTGVVAPEVMVVGAHYDSARGAPGANDNASGVAAVIELARLLRDLGGKTDKRIRLVLFVNEEPPWFGTDAMGSLRYAQSLADHNENVVGMFSLETIGFYSSESGSQRYPAPFGMLFPDRADFVAFVGLLGSRTLVRETMRSFRAHTAFPTVGGVAPGFVSGIGWSDHWAFAKHGFPALMITDTALFRYPHYHQPSDTPDKVDVANLARLVKGIERVIRDAVR